MTILDPAEPETHEGNGQLIRVLLVDDHPFLRCVLAEFIDAEPDLKVIGQASTGLAAVRLAEELNPDVVLMDVNLPTLSGVEATRRIRASRPDIWIIALSMHNDPPFADAMREAGAADYIAKDAAPDSLLRAIRCIRPH